jgi:hypothetical protein
MMKGFLLFIVVVAALFFYMNSNSEVDIIEVQRIAPQEKESVLLQENTGMTGSKVVAQVAATPLIKEELGIVMPSKSLSVSFGNDLSGGIDDIGGYYDVNARTPESESQQYNEVTSIGVDTSGDVMPEMDFDYIDIEGDPPSINKGKHRANSQGY